MVENPNKELVAMVFEMQIGMIIDQQLNMAATKSSNLWLDTGATIHICNDKSMFSTYEEKKDDEVVLMKFIFQPRFLEKYVWFLLLERN